MITTTPTTGSHPHPPASRRPAPAQAAPVELPDRFDVHEVDAVLARILAAAERRSVVRVDCRRVRFMDEAAIQGLLNGSLHCAERGAVLVLTSLSAAARVTLELTGSAQLFTMDESTGALR